MRRIVLASAAAATLALAGSVPATAAQEKRGHGHGGHHGGHGHGHGGHGHGHGHGHGGHGGKKDADKWLRKLVNADGIKEHLAAFQGIADANGGNRAAAHPGYDGSVNYVVDRLTKAGYNVQKVPFDYPNFVEASPSTLEQVSPTAKAYVNPTDFVTAQFSGRTEGPLEKQVVPTNDIQIPPGAEAGSSNSGCEPADFPAETSGNISLIQRGTCNFVVKIANAKAAGAVGVIIFNEGQTDRTEPVPFAAEPYETIPVLSSSFGTGEELYNAAKAGPTTIRINVDATTTPREQFNVIADSKWGDPNQTVVVGAHLDSVEEGPGINDNGSGSAQNIEIAETISKLKLKPKRRIRFAFWGAEEAGLIGSTAYVNSLPESARKQILLNLNFDMVGSPNYVRFVYDGDTSDTPPPAGGAPAGSGQIEKSFLDYFASVGLATEPTAFDGRSDYGPFIANGIPAGGLFSGAEGEKTPEEAAVYGGTAGEWYDSCYHQACDTFPSNVNDQALNEFSDAAASVTWKYASSKEPLVKKAKARGGKRKFSPLTTSRFEYAGPYATR